MAIGWLKWLRGAWKTRRSPQRRSGPRWRFPLLELLEDRLAPASYIWAGPTSGQWSNPQNWFGGPEGTIPGTADSVLINASGPAYTVVVDVDVAVADLVVDSPSATLQIIRQDITVSGSAQLLAGTTLLTDAGWFGPGLVLNQATMLVQGHVDFQAPLQQNGFLAVLGSPSGPADMVVTGSLINTGLIVLQSFIPEIDSPTGPKASTPSMGAQLVLAGGDLTNAPEGQIVLHTGTLLLFNGGTHNLAPFSSVVGGGDVLVLAGVVTVAGDYQLGRTQVEGGRIDFVSSGQNGNGPSEPATTGLLDLKAGSLGGDRPLLVTGGFTWSGGTLANTGGFTSAGVAVIHGPGSKHLNGTLINAGILSWTGTGAIESKGGQLTNLPGALLLILNSAVYQGSAGALFDNQGIVRKLGSTGTTTFRGQGLVVQNSGTFELKKGRLRLANLGGGTSDGSFQAAAGTTLIFDHGVGGLDVSGGVWDFGPASQLTGAGVVRFQSGLVNFHGLYDVGGAGQTVIAGGEVAFHAATTLRRVVLVQGLLEGFAPLQLAVSLDWRGGTLAGDLLILPAAVVSLTGPAAKTLLFGSVSNQGTVHWNGGNLFLGAYFQNEVGGRFLVRSDRRLEADGEGGAFLNLGLFRKAAGAGTTALAAPFTNQGTVEILAGKLAFPVGPYFQEGPGAVTFLNGTVLESLEGVEIAGGQLIGSGLIRGSVVNDGILRPGNPIGVLAIQGNYVQGPNGILQIQFAASAGHDQLQVSGAVGLQGTVQVLAAPGFAPAGGDRFVIVTYKEPSEDGSAKEGLDLGDGRSFEPDFGDSELVLTVPGPVPLAPPPALGEPVADAVDPLFQVGLAVVASTPDATPPAAGNRETLGRLALLHLATFDLPILPGLTNPKSRFRADYGLDGLRSQGEEEPLGEIQGQVFTDFNADGYQQSVEEPRDNQLVYLDHNRNGRFDAGEPYTVTNSNGEYRFRNVSLGVHAVNVRLGRTSSQTYPSEPHHRAEVSRSRPLVPSMNFGVLDRRLVRPASRPAAAPVPVPAPAPTRTGGPVSSTGGPAANDAVDSAAPHAQP
jgi:hypothetical protein